MFSSGGDLCYTPEKVCKLITASVVMSNYCLEKRISVLDEDEDYMNQIILPELALD
jgi:hypothetical protein